MAHSAAAPLPRSESGHLAWRDEYQAGHPRIDAQHRQLFAAVNALFAEAAERVTPRCIELLDELIMIAMNHFEDEEDEMARAGYPDLEAHRREHADLLLETLMQRQRLIDDPTCCHELMDYLAAEVVSRHMLGSDRRFHAMLHRVSASRPEGPERRQP